MKTQKITAEIVRNRLAYGVCPNCGNYTLVKRSRMIVLNERSERVKKFAGSFWACGSEESHQCYHMSETALRESIVTTSV